VNSRGAEIVGHRRLLTPVRETHVLKLQFDREVAAAGLHTGQIQSRLVTEGDLAALPEAARHYLHFMGVVGRPRDWSFRLHCTARFKPALDAEWRPAESWQYNSALDVARIYHMKLHFYGIPVIGRDVYIHGAGHLVIRPLDLVTVEYDSGPELDRSALVTWLNDAVLFAPAMLLGTNTRWSSHDPDAFGLSFTDSGHTVTAQVRIDARGAPLDFETDVRSMRDPKTKRLRRARWSTPIPGWQNVDGRQIPTGGRAVWHLPAGDFAYAELTIRPDDIQYNVSP
jgi:hypothetical protein